MATSAPMEQRDLSTSGKSSEESHIPLNPVNNKTEARKKEAESTADPSNVATSGNEYTQASPELIGTLAADKSARDVKEDEWKRNKLVLCLLVALVITAVIFCICFVALCIEVAALKSKSNNNDVSVSIESLRSSTTQCTSLLNSCSYNYSN